MTERSGRGFTTTEHVARGPIAFISTTTKDQIEIDDETRHISIWIDSSADQTRQILDRYASERGRLSQAELRTWRQVQKLVRKRASVPVKLPVWFHRVAQRTYAKDVRVRRYFPAFIEACKVVSLLRSFQRFKSPPASIEIEFADFAITTQIFEGVFTESLHRGSEQTVETRNHIETLSKESGGAPVGSKALAQRLGISKDRAYALLRRATAAGTIRKVNPTAKTNRKLLCLYLYPGSYPSQRSSSIAVQKSRARWNL